MESETEFLLRRDKKKLARRYNFPIIIPDISLKLSCLNSSNNNNIVDNLLEYLSESQCVVGSCTTRISPQLRKILQYMPYGVMILFDKYTTRDYCNSMKKISSKIKTINCTQYTVTYENSDSDDDYNEWVDSSYVDIPVSTNDDSFRWTDTIDNFLILGDVDVKKVNGTNIKRFVPKRIWIGYLKKFSGSVAQSSFMIDNQKLAEEYMNHWNSMLLMSESIEYESKCCF
jgi:hypothetical protein